MRRLLLALLLVAAVGAVDIDAETGCEIYSDHLLCPQGTDVSVNIRYTTDSDCFSLQNEFGNLENLGCSATAELRESLEYEDCWLYVPFDETDISLDEIDYNYQCSTQKLGSGETVQIIGFEEHYSDCTTIAEDEYTGDYVCPVNGKDYSIKGNVAIIDGQYSIVLYTQEGKAAGIPFAEDAAPAVVLLAIAILLVYALYIWSERKK